MITDTSGVFKLKQLPKLKLGEARYLMAAGGLYYEQHDELFHASTQIHKFYRDVKFGSMQLLDHEEFFQPKFPLLPEALIQQCLGFFQHIEDQHDCECGLVLLYDPDKRQYQWCCPQQTISKYDLKFTTPIPGKDYPEHLLHFGDVHLHPGMSAYHSGTDYDDEMLASDGLHLVVGTPKVYGYWDETIGKWISAKKYDKKTKFCATFVSDGARFEVDPEVVMELTVERGLFPPSWLDQCQLKPKYQSTSWLGGTRSEQYGGAYD
jgi:hypothetical protein